MFTGCPTNLLYLRQDLELSSTEIVFFMTLPCSPHFNFGKQMTVFGGQIEDQSVKTYVLVSSFLKGTSCEDTNWPERVETVQMFPLSGFMCLCQFVSTEVFFVVVVLFLFLLQTGTPQGTLIPSLPMRNRERLAHDITQTCATHGGLVHACTHA